MKKFITLITVCFLLINVYNTYAQSPCTPWCIQGNVLGGNEWLGSISGPYALSFGTIPSQPINFYTSGNQQMTLTSIGWLGIGLNFIAPQNLLHLNQWDTGHVFTQWTNSNTGSGAGNGYKNGILSNGTVLFSQYSNQMYRFDMRNEAGNKQLIKFTIRDTNQTNLNSLDKLCSS